MNMVQTLLLAAGLMTVLGLLAMAFVGPSPRKELQRRILAVRERYSENASAKVEAQMRKAIANRKPRFNQTGEDLTKVQMLARRLAMTGKNWTVMQFAQMVIGLGLAVALLVYLRSGHLVMSLFIGSALGFGLPHMVVGHFIKRRLNGFTKNFPDAIDLLVRGLRSGLPVTETLQVVAKEIPGPVGEEFKLVTERIKIGRSMEDALQESANRLQTPEFNFFCITLAIQRETGGNLAETLSNLGAVLRSRAQMKLKIRALSSESKASAYIVGSLPFLVFIMIWWVNPDYLAGFFSEERLMIAGLGGLLWMSIGVFIMAKMVSFEI
ncbi:type II secretion system F family protein [Blastomonas sp.]|uniref:type II secretion system F family protein n=1 Tax=Blastomonas sp. TaxID=1909299 RepID=UPI002639D1F3|nr:type II secretion system F family protein [Blastomonas sp.]MDM7955034.1 type II secretion system F family protein [Blastomonas sp.]